MGPQSLLAPHLLGWPGSLSTPLVWPLIVYGDFVSLGPVSITNFVFLCFSCVFCGTEHSARLSLQFVITE